jgi:uncharacterized protein (DUF362 family)
MNDYTGKPTQIEQAQPAPDVASPEPVVPSPQGLDRRDFLRRGLGVGITLAATAALGYGLHDALGPGAAPRAHAPVKLPDFSLPAQAGRMAIVQGADRVAALQAGLKTLGGLEGFVSKGDRVLIKVNAGFATPPSLGATTNPEILAELTRLCLAAGAEAVVVTDNPINDAVSCFQLTGLGEAAVGAGAKLMLPEERFFRPTTVEGGRLIVDWPLLAAPFAGVNKVIGLSPVKDHHRSGASMSMKNWYGLLGGRRNVFHQDIHTVIKELAMLVRPTLVVLDGVLSMQSNGPTGGSLEDLKATNTLIVSTDQVAADACGATLLGKTAADLPFIGQAAAAGLGQADFMKLAPARVSL